MKNNTTKQIGIDLVANLNRNVTDGGGMSSLLNDMKYDFKNGQKIKYKDYKTGKPTSGTYMFAASYDDFIVVKKKGMAQIVRISNVL